MLTVDQANELTGHVVMFHDGKKYRHTPARLIRVVNEYTAVVKPGNGHQRMETVALGDLFRHEKSVFEGEARAVAQRRNLGIAEPGEPDGDEAETPVIHLVVDLGSKMFWGEPEPGKEDFVPDLKRAKLYSSWSRARVARSKLVWTKRDTSVPFDVEVVTSERARNLCVEWAKIPNPQPCIEPEVLETPTIGDMLAKSQPVAEPETLTMPQPAKKPDDGEWVDSHEVARLARPRSGITSGCIVLWARGLHGSMPEGSVSRIPAYNGKLVYRFNLAVLRSTGWLDNQLKIDARVAEGNAPKYTGRGPRHETSAAPAPVVLKIVSPKHVAKQVAKPESEPEPQPVKQAPVKPSGAKANLAKSILDVAEYEALAYESQAGDIRAKIEATKLQMEMEIERLKAKAAGVRAEAAMRVENL